MLSRCPLVGGGRRCCIFLGDLARYKELHSGHSAKDFGEAERRYRQALAVLPSRGNPHNQLAVLATYNKAELVSVSHYCRALCCAQPFATARNNLLFAFKRNLQASQKSR